jgi:lauroyl/myristoyl acyltransferase
LSRTTRKQKTQQNPGFIAYRYAVAPVLAFLPSKVAYGFALFFGSLLYSLSHRSRVKIVKNLEWASVGGRSDEERERSAEEFYRLRCCEAMEDLMLLKGPGPLARSVDFRGLEQMKESFASGRGIVLCGAHFGSFKSSLSLLGTMGFPITPLMRRPPSAGPNASLLQRAVFWVQSYALLHNMKRANIPVQSGDPKADIVTATLAAKYLKSNEIIYVNLDATVLPEYRSRSFVSEFLGKKALFLTGAIFIAKATGAKVHVMLVHRSADLRHNTVTISPSIPMEGSVEDGFRRCLKFVDEAVRLEPAEWEMWDLLPGQGTFFPDLAPT